MNSVTPRSNGVTLYALLFLVVVGGVGLFLYLPTLTASYAYDDMDLLNLTADVLSGHRGFWELVFRPHNEHLIPLVRIVFLASAALFGYDAFPFRLLVLLAHLGSAFFIAMIVRRYASDRVSPFAAGLAYVVPVGFSSMWVWWMVCSGGSLGMLGITGGLAALVYRDRVGSVRARWLAGAGILLAVASENALAPIALGPILLDWDQRRRERGKARPGPLTVFGLAAIAGCLALSAYLYKSLTGAAPSVNLRAGLPRTAWLLLVSPFRYFCPAAPLPAGPPRTAVLLGALYGLFILAVAAAVALAVAKRPQRELLRIAVIAAVGPIAAVALVGLGRWRNTFQELYEADRYFFTLLVPIALFAGAVCSGIRDAASAWTRPRARALAALAVVALGVEIVGHRKAIGLRFPRQVFDAHERRFRELSDLAKGLSEAARGLPAGEQRIEFPDGSFWFPDVHNGRLSARVLFTIASHGVPGVHLDGERVSERDERLINPVLESWARRIGETFPYFSVADGRLVNAREVEVADFRKRAHDEVIVSGFFGWENSYRWMGPRGELRLVMNDPVLVLSLGSLIGELRKKNPGLSSMGVRVTLVAEESGAELSPGAVELAEDGMHSYKLDARPLLSRLGRGRVVHVVLEASPDWRPMDVLPRSQDPRILTVQVFLAGFQGS
jgi:hypothetical protein